MPRMKVSVGEGCGGFATPPNQDGGGLLSIGRLEYREDGFKIVWIASIALGQEMGFVLAA